MAEIIQLQTVTDQALKRRYLERVAKLGLRKDPMLMTRIEQELTPEKIAAWRDDMQAVVFGEPLAK